MKTTKKNYSRRKLVAGIAIFASVALIGSGFAAFVISANQSRSVEGNIEIGKVEEQSVSITNVALSESKIQFEPKAEDTTGRVRYDGTNKEILSTTLSFTFNHSDMVESIHVGLEVPEGIKNAATATANYITLPAAVNGVDIALTGDKSGATISDVTDTTNTKTVSYTIAFGWGSAFNGKNPGEYYDTDDAGKAVDDAAMKSTLTAFHDLLATEGTMKVNLSVKLN